MKASEVIMRLQTLQHHQGDLDVLVHVVSENQVFPLECMIEVERYSDDNPRPVFVLHTESLEV